MPGPPAPPRLPAARGGGGGGDARGALLADIRGGATLKKTVTNDRSAPVVGEYNPFILRVVLPLVPLGAFDPWRGCGRWDSIAGSHERGWGWLRVFVEHLLKGSVCICKGEM